MKIKKQFLLTCLLLIPLIVLGASNCREILDFIEDIPCFSELDEEVIIEKYGKKRFPPEDDWGGTRSRVSGTVKSIVTVGKDGKVKRVIPVDYDLYIFIEESVATLLDTELSIGKVDGKATEYLIPLTVIFDVTSDDTQHIRKATTRQWR